MALFKRNKEKENKEPEKPAEQEQQQEAPRAVPRAILDPRRMGAVYLRMYRWVFSASLNYDSYQIESGRGEYFGGELPMRGYFSKLLETLQQSLLEEQQAHFAQTFFPAALYAAFSNGRTYVSDVFYVKTGETYTQPGESEETEPTYSWFEIRAERIPDTNEQAHQLLLYVREISGEKDDGRIAEQQELPKQADGGYDWMEIRSDRLLNNEDIIYYEYDIQEDSLHIHRRRGEKQIDRTEKSYLATLGARSDWMVFHDDVQTVRTLFQKASQGIAGEAELRYRKDGMQGAKFIHYLMSCRPLEEVGTPTWLFGSLQDIDEKVQKREQEKELMVQMDSMLSSFYTNMFQIDANRGLIYHIINTGTGFQREKTPVTLDTYIQRLLSTSVIAPEHVKEYSNWAKPGYFQRKTLKGDYEFEARLRLLGSPDFHWYSETITPVKDRPGVYMRLRRDIDEAHKLRQHEYEMEEHVRFAEYNRSVLDTMAGLVEFRNAENGLHIARVRALTNVLLTEIARRCPQYGLTQTTIDLYTQASTIHDLGKITIPDSILNKAGRLTPEEYETMKAHTVNGVQIVNRMEMPGMDDLKECCRDVVRHHHERFDGRGYPDGLVGDKISIGVQAVSLADVYDALVSVRCYKEAFDFDQAKNMILGGECGVFNPMVLESMVAVEAKMRKIYESNEAISEREIAAAEGLLQEHQISGGAENV